MASRDTGLRPVRERLGVRKTQTSRCSNASRTGRRPVSRGRFSSFEQPVAHYTGAMSFTPNNPFVMLGPGFFTVYTSACGDVW
jgi:hypothetical protein